MIHAYAPSSNLYQSSQQLISKFKPFSSGSRASAAVNTSCCCQSLLGMNSQFISSFFTFVIPILHWGFQGPVYSTPLFSSLLSQKDEDHVPFLLIKPYWRIQPRWMASSLSRASLWSQSGCRLLSKRGSTSVLSFLGNVCAACKDTGGSSQCDSELNYGRVFCSIVFSDKINDSCLPFPSFFSIKLTCLLPR